MSLQSLSIPPIILRKLTLNAAPPAMGVCPIDSIKRPMCPAAKNATMIIMPNQNLLDILHINVFSFYEDFDWVK